MFKFLCKAAGMVAATVIILKIGDAVAKRFCGKQHGVKIISDADEAGSIGIIGNDRKKAANISIIGGADGPTAIYITGRANPQAVSNVFSRLADVAKFYLSKI